MITLVAALALLVVPQESAPIVASPVSELQGLHEFGTCVARDRIRVGSLLETVPGTPEEHDILVALVQKGCPSMNEFTLDPSLLRGIVAEAMFERDFGALDAPARRRAVSVFTVPSGPQFTSLPAGAQRSVGMIDYATCVVQAAPQQTVTVLHTVPGSASERSAFSALGPTLGPCLPEGMTAEFTPAQLRGALAEAAYRAAAAKR
jgi:hypothetical protein